MTLTAGSESKPTVVSDASPLHYLILIDQAELLHVLYGKVLIPLAVAEELQRSATPKPVRHWMARPPAWLITTASAAADIDPPLAILGRGEREAIALARERNAALVIMDDREGVDEALHMGLKVTGTLGVLDQASSRKLVDIPVVLAALGRTNFRVKPALIRAMIEQDRRRREAI